MEPAAVLVVAFKVKVGLTALVVAAARMRALEHGGVRGAGVEPDFENVAALGVVRRVCGAQDGFGAGLAPGLDAALLHHVGGDVEDLHRARMQLAAVLVQEEGQGHAPAALAADAPVGPARDHVAQTHLAVFRVEGSLLDRVQRNFAQRLRRLVLGEHTLAFVHADEPLGGGAVNHRRLVAPAVRVAVGDGGGGKQTVRLAQHLDDARAGFPDIEAAKQWQFGFIAAVALHRVQDVVVLHAVRNTAVEILHAVGRRRVHDAGAVVGRGVLGQVDRAQAIKASVDVRQRVFEVDATQALAQCGGDHRAGQAIALQAFVHQHRGQNQQAARRLHQRILKRRVQVERLVRGDGPGRGGPDHGEGRAVQARQTEGGGQLVRLGAEEADVKRLRLLVGVFDLELGQARAAVETPVHGLQAAVDEAAFHHALEGADLVGFIAEVHGAVGMVPVAQHAQALEVGALDVDLLGGKSAALGLHLVARQIAAELLFDRVLDRQAVAIPARDVDRVQPLELARLDDHVFEDLVDGVAHVDLAVGIRRAVVQYKLRRARARGAQLRVQALLFPFAHPVRLALGQVTAHGKRGVGQVQGTSVINFFGHDKSQFGKGGTQRA